MQPTNAPVVIDTAEVNDLGTKLDAMLQEFRSIGVPGNSSLIDVWLLNKSRNQVETHLIEAKMWLDKVVGSLASSEKMNPLYTSNDSDMPAAQADPVLPASPDPTFPAASTETLGTN